MKSEVMRTGLISTRDMIANGVQNIDDEAQSPLQDIPGLSHTIRNWKQHSLGFPSLPTSRSGFEIPDTVKYLENGSLFLAFDSGIDDPDTILIFATEKV